MPDNVNNRFVYCLPILALLAGLSFPAPASAQDFNKRIELAIKKGTDYLLSQQQTKLRLVAGDDELGFIDLDAQWKDVTVVGLTKEKRLVRVKGKEHKDVFALLAPGWFAPEPLAKNPLVAINVGGQSSLATLALLSAGLSPTSDKRVAAAVDSVLHQHVMQRAKAGDTKAEFHLMPGCLGTYAIGLRANALEHAMRHTKTGPAHTAMKNAVQREVTRLQDGWAMQAGYGYLMKGNNWDMSNTQYGILGLWAGHRGGLEISEKTLRHFNSVLLDAQNKDGGWPYRSKEETTGPMTTGGIASLYVMMDLLHARTRGANKPDITPFTSDPLLSRTVNSIDKAMEFFGRIYRTTGDGYINYGIERIGVASGHKYFGNHDWFREGAEEVLKTQRADGSWAGDKSAGPVCETAWNILFLVYGGAPVLINKLHYGSAGDWQWNNYPRDAANLVGWYGRFYEGHANWQILDLDPRREEDLLDAPILYISGYKELVFKDSEVEMLRRYVERGGTLMFVADAGRREFIDGILKLSEKLYPPERFPEYQFTAVPKTHPIYKLQGGEPDPALEKLPLWHMSNGVRSFAFLSPEDINHLWQGNKYTTRREAFQFVGNLRNYCTDRAAKLPPKIRPAVTAGEARFAGDPTPVRIGVLRHTSKGIVRMQAKPGVDPEKPIAVAADWNAAPLTWRLYNEWLRHTAGLDIDETRDVPLADNPKLATFHVLHLTGRHAITMNAADRAALKDYLTAGGTLLIEPIGGVGTEFAASALEILRAMFPDKVERPAANNPLLTGVGGLRPVPNSDFTSRQVQLSRPDLRSAGETCWTVNLDGRTAVLLCQFDLSLAISGQTCWERMGFTADAARTLTANFLAGARRK